MKKGRFGIVLIALYTLGFAAILYFLLGGLGYYSTPIIDRPRMEDHTLLKPGGMTGHTLGIVGSSMLLLLFLYSVRKRRTFGLRKWKLARWLDIHIWLGIMGPLLITLHSAFKFGGIISISYFSMMAVMLSGFIGRYIYMQIPRDEKGIAIPLREIDDRIETMTRTLAGYAEMPQQLIEVVETGSDRIAAVSGEGVRGLFGVLVSDFMRPVRKFTLRRRIQGTHPDLPRATVREVVRLADRRGVLQRRRILLETATSVFHLWHIIHKPFAVVMVAIMLVHIAVVVAMGYRWVF